MAQNVTTRYGRESKKRMDFSFVEEEKENTVVVPYKPRMRSVRNVQAVLPSPEALKPLSVPERVLALLAASSNKPDPRLDQAAAKLVNQSQENLRPQAQRENNSQETRSAKRGNSSLGGSSSEPIVKKTPQDVGVAQKTVNNGGMKNKTDNHVNANGPPTTPSSFLTGVLPRAMAHPPTEEEYKPDLSLLCSLRNKPTSVPRSTVASRRTDVPLLQEASPGSHVLMQQIAKESVPKAAPIKETAIVAQQATVLPNQGIDVATRLLAMPSKPAKLETYGFQAKFLPGKSKDFKKWSSAEVAQWVGIIMPGNEKVEDTQRKIMDADLDGAMLLQCKNKETRNLFVNELQIPWCHMFRMSGHAAALINDNEETRYNKALENFKSSGNRT